ncbi:Pumilio -like protein 2 [Halotydeus destructor]|nr:Pumilio -like protein 2 [Halotydeus destructor]
MSTRPMQLEGGPSSNGADPANSNRDGSGSGHSNSNRSQDDAMVGYFFQRPQTDADFQNYPSGSKQTRWALGDDTMLESRQTMASDSSDLDNEFQGLSLGSEIVRTASKKIWGDEPVASNKHVHDQHEDSKSLFLGGDPQWRDSTWSTPGNQPSDHAVSQPILMGGRRSGSFPGSGEGAMLSPRSTDTGGLGVKMVEYVLGTSPTGKDMDPRMSRFGHQVSGNDNQSMDKMRKKNKGYDPEGAKMKDDVGPVQNGMGMQNGMDDKGFDRTPGSYPDDELVKNSDGQVIGKHQLGAPSGGHLYDHAFDSQSLGMDSLHFSDFPSHLMHSSIDSPGVLDYNHTYQQRNASGPSQMHSHAGQGSGQMMHHPQANFSQGHGNTGAGPNPFPQNPYYQDPMAAQMGHLIPAGPPAMVPSPYYGMPWGMYPPPNGMGQPGGPPPMQQQQMMQRGPTAGGRPLSPNSTVDNSAHGGNMQQAGQYPMIPPHGYYDQNTPYMMGNQPGSQSRNMNPAAMRMMPPPMMMNQQPGNMRMMPGNGQQANVQNQAGPLFQGNNGNGFAPSSASGMGYANSNTASNAMNFGHVNGQGYGLGPIGGSLNMDALNMDSPIRRDSFDRRDSFGTGIFSQNMDGQFSRHGGKNQYYPMGPGVTPSPGPIGMMPNSHSPPPIANGLVGPGRMSAAPGAEGKYRGAGNRFSAKSANNAEFNNRLLQNATVDKAAAQGRSRLLEEFRNNRHPQLQLRDLTDHIVEFSQDQHGSRFIQQKLERASVQEKQLVFNEIIGNAYNLMTDVFGNYVIQKFFEFGTTEQKQALAMKVKGHVLPLALQMYGCRVIQKALESIPPDQQKEIVLELDGHVLKCVKDQNGNHVVQKCIECVDPHSLQFIIGAFQNQVFALSTHPYGCRVIQRILEHCTPEQTAPILEELHSHTEQLVQDQYGNYVIQHVLEHGRPEDKSKLITGVRGKVLPLSQHKFASNVVEKCVCYASRAERAFLIDEVCAYGGDGNGSHSALYTMMKDQYANYVVQKMIEVAEAPQRKSLIQRIRPQVATLRKYTYGKHILAKLEKYMIKNSNDLGPIGAPSTNAAM